VVFGSYNFYGKVSDHTVEVWAELLRRVPRARLRLKNAGFGEASARERVRQELAGLGIDAERLELVPHTRTREEHLQSYIELDVALDTFPYNGTTTTCEALWMGTPVVCLAGEAHAARVGVSLLEAIGRPELVAVSEARYVEIAVELAAQTPAQRADLARSLRAQLLASPLGRGRALSLALEKLFTSERRGSTAAE
jgi:protein O-GlcNAc transferase